MTRVVIHLLVIDMDLHPYERTCGADYVTPEDFIDLHSFIDEIRRVHRKMGLWVYFTKMARECRYSIGWRFALTTLPIWLLLLSTFHHRK